LTLTHCNDVLAVLLLLSLMLVLQVIPLLL
jgi:hypothetical protein